MLRIGAGAGFSGDRIEPAETLLKKGDLDYLVLECLAERTIALAEKRKLHDLNVGYDPLLEKRIRPILPLLLKKQVRLITNMGAGNPTAGAKKILEIAKELDLPCKIAVVSGDNVLEQIDQKSKIWENDSELSDYSPILSANAYLGAESLLPALQSDANIIITGRVADPSLFLAPQIHYFKWSLDDYEKLGQGTVNGHLLECAGQVSGGYFADPDYKDVHNLAHLGFPYAEIDEKGNSIITKVKETGGLINLKTVKEQLLYEVHNPSEYVTPDVIANFSSVHIEEVGENRITVSNGGGKQRPETLKVSVGYHAGYIGEGEISYAGTSSVERAKLAGEILKERLTETIKNLRIDYIGLSSMHRTNLKESTPYEIRVRAAGSVNSKCKAQLIGEEVEALYLNGPAGGGGARKEMKESIGIVSTTIPRSQVKTKVDIKEVKI